MGPKSEFLSIANFWHALNRAWTCAEHECSLSWVAAPLTNIQLLTTATKKTILDVTWVGPRLASAKFHLPLLSLQLNTFNAFLTLFSVKYCWTRPRRSLIDGANPKGASETTHSFKSPISFEVKVGFFLRLSNKSGILRFCLLWCRCNVPSGIFYFVESFSNDIPSCVCSAMASSF